MGLSCGKSALADKALVLRGSSFKKTAQREQRPTISNGNVAAMEQLASVRDQGIVVLLRIRPKSEKEGKQRCFLEVQGPTQLYVPASKITPTEKTVSFDAVLPATTSQEEVYRVAGPKLLHNVLQGFNATMIAYGQTGSGKTFTMEGVYQDPGVTPRLCGGLFDAIARLRREKEVCVLASYVEIYNENIRDLLEPVSSNKRAVSPTVSRPTRSPSVSPTGEDNNGGGVFDGGGSGNGKPNIRENKDGVYVENVTAEKVDSEAAVLALLARGSHARTTGETQMNAASSRSHAVLMLAIKQTPLDEEERGGGGSGGGGGLNIGTIRSKISLVDLAGSERAKSTGAAGQRLKEGAQINKSLSALGNVIKALTSGGNAHIPYRDSKLTRLLQDSLGGTAYTVVCCNVSPIEASEAETLSTLRFAERLKKVKNKMVVHMDARSKELLILKRENAELKAKIARLEEMLASANSAGGGSSRGSSQNLPAGIRRGSNNSVLSRAAIGDRSEFGHPVV